MLAKIMMILLFFAVTIGVGVSCRKRASGVGDFVLGGRDVGPWLTAFAYGTSYFSAVVFVGYAGQYGWNFGLSATWIGLGNALIGSLLAWTVLGRRTRVMTKYFDSATMPDFFAKRYDCEWMRSAVSAIIFIFLVPYSASVYKGLSGLFSMSFGIDYNYCVIGIAVITALYVVLGGYMAAALNDLIQGVIMLAGICVVIAGVLQNHGGLTESLRQLSQISCESDPAMAGAFTSFFGPAPLELLSIIILTSLGTWGLPQMIHKFYTIRNEKSIQAGTVISTLFAVVIAGGSYFMGGFARLFYQPENGKVVFDDIVPNMLAQSLPDLIIGVVLILVLSASMSTLSSLVITSSSTFTLDFVAAVRRRRMKERQQIRLIKLLCVCFVILSVVLAISPNQLITSLMSLSWGTLAGSFLGPFLYGLFWKGTTRSGAWAGLICGVVINSVNLACKIVSPPVAGAASILFSLIIVPLVSFVTPKLPAAHVQEVFSCYDETVEISRRFALNETEE